MGHLDLVEYLIHEKNFDIHERANDGRNAFLFAVGSKNFKLVNYLVELGADVNATNFKSQNAILLSIKSKSGVYNIASGTTTSINNLAKLLKELFNKKSKIIFKPIRPGEIIFSAANVDKSQKELKFHPKISLNDGLKLI